MAKQVAKKKRTQELWQSKLGTSALNPIQVMELQDALKERAVRVQLEGRWFSIRYEPDGKTIYYSPEEGYTPSGYLNISHFLSDW